MKRHDLIRPSVLAAAAVLLLAGCARQRLHTKPMPASAPAPAASVALRVVDERPPTRWAGKDPGRSGARKLRHSQRGEGLERHVAPRTVADATHRRPASAGVGVKDGAGRTLVATISTSGWTDFRDQGDRQNPVALQDSAGKHSGSGVAGGAGGALIFRSLRVDGAGHVRQRPRRPRAKAADQFKSAEFQKALS